MTELACRAFGALPPPIKEPSLLHSKFGSAGVVDDGLPTVHLALVQRDNEQRERQVYAFGGVEKQ